MHQFVRLKFSFTVIICFTFMSGTSTNPVSTSTSPDFSSTPMPCESVDSCELNDLRREMNEKFASLVEWMKISDNQYKAMTKRIDRLEFQDTSLDKDVDSVAKFLINLLKFMDIIPACYTTNSRRLNELGLVNENKTSCTTEAVNVNSTTEVSQTVKTTIFDEQFSTEQQESTTEVSQNVETTIFDEQFSTEQQESTSMHNTGETEYTTESDRTEEFENTTKHGNTNKPISKPANETDTSIEPETTKQTEISEKLETTENQAVTQEMGNTTEAESTQEQKTTSNPDRTKASEEITKEPENTTPSEEPQHITPSVEIETKLSQGSTKVLEVTEETGSSINIESTPTILPSRK